MSARQLIVYWGLTRLQTAIYSGILAPKDQIINYLHINTIMCTLWMKFYIWRIQKSKTSTQNLECSECQTHKAHTCKLSQAKTTEGRSYQKVQTAPIYIIPTHPVPQVELYIAVKCKDIYRVTNNDNRKKNQHTHTPVSYTHLTLPTTTYV